MKIVILDGATLNPGDNPWTEIEQLGEVVVYPKTSAAQVAERIEGSEIAVTNKVPISRETMERVKSLKLIAVTATGFNIVDIDAATHHGIVVSNVPIYGTDTVAQHVMAMLLAFVHRPFAHDDAIRRGEWSERGDFSFWLNPLHELAGRTMGIVGFGRIGRRVGELANAFGMSVIAHNPRPKPDPDFSPFVWGSLTDVFRESDVISLNCPQTKENVGFVNSELIGLMRPESLLINASRGGLINEQHLADALNAGQIGGALLDVFSSEPIDSANPLLAAKNCLLTPHYAWATRAARQRLMKATADNIRAFISGQPIHIVNPS